MTVRNMVERYRYKYGDTYDRIAGKLGMSRQRLCQMINNDDGMNMKVSTLLKLAPEIDCDIKIEFGDITEQAYLDGYDKDEVTFGTEYLPYEPDYSGPEPTDTEQSTASECVLDKNRIGTKVQFHMNIPYELHRKLKAYAVKKHLPVSVALRQMIEKSVGCEDFGKK